MLPSAGNPETATLSWSASAAAATSALPPEAEPSPGNASASAGNATWDLGLRRSRAATAAAAAGVFEGELLIPLYAIIFVLAVVGNALVVVTLAQNKRMRTVTNVYLLNLAVSDLLLGVFCMPFTLVGQLLRNFIFGGAMCRLIPYFQAVSVSVGVWTLVAISLERYFAICRPLKSRRWQTQFHAYKMIAVVWLASLAWSSPVLLASRLQPMRDKGRHKCREEWPTAALERAYNLFLDAMLLLVPLLIMSLAYSLIVSKLWKGLRREIQHNSSCRRQQSAERCMGRSLSSATDGGLPTPQLVATPRAAARTTALCDKQTPPRLWFMVRVPSPADGCAAARPSGCSLRKATSLHAGVTASLVAAGNSAVGGGNGTGGGGSGGGGGALLRSEAARLLPASKEAAATATAADGDADAAQPPTYTFTRHAIRSNYMDKSIEAKKKVIRMLFVVVLEFFICWAPLHVLNTWYLFSPDVVYMSVGRTGVALVQLLAYISSCCNPITYCFMNRKFRAAFLGVFGCRRGGGCCGGGSRAGHVCALQRPALAANNSDASGNDSTQCALRASIAARSEVLTLEAEDRV